MGLRARNSETGEVMELQDGAWVQVSPPRTSVGNAVAGSVEGARAVGDYLSNLISAGITKFKELGPTETESTLLSRQGGTLQQEVQAESQPVPELVKRAALPVAGGLVAGGPGALVGEVINQATGITEPSLTELALSGLTPPGARGTFRASKAAVRGGTGFIAPQAIRESGVELVRDRFSGAASRQLYNQVIDKGMVPTHQIGLTIERMIVEEAATASPRKAAINALLAAPSVAPVPNRPMSSAISIIAFLSAPENVSLIKSSWSNRVLTLLF